MGTASQKNKEQDISSSSAQQIQKLEALGRFAGGIAHDFNNILSIIEGHVSISMKQLKEDKLDPKQLEKILQATQRGAGLTQQLLSFGRMKVDVEEKINMAEVLQEVHVLLRPVIGDGIKLFMTVPDEAVWVSASKDQITQVILNLALNSRDAMPSTGELAVIIMPCQRVHVPAHLRNMYPTQNFLRLSIVDSGEGMPQDIIDRAFEPFFTTKDQGKGTGLGLSVVYGIVDQLKGAIEISSFPGEGTSIDIYLPEATAPAHAGTDTKVDMSHLDDERTETKTVPIKGQKPLKGKTILVAEDETELREVLQEMFEGMGMNVLTAGNGNEALRVQDEYDGQIDILLTDVVMPEMDGVHLSELFHSVRPQSNVVYMSGYPFMDGRKDIEVPEDADFISKPLKEDKLQQILSRALQKRQQRVGEERAQ